MMLVNNSKSWKGNSFDVAQSKCRAGRGGRQAKNSEERLGKTEEEEGFVWWLMWMWMMGDGCWMGPL